MGEFAPHAIRRLFDRTAELVPAAGLELGGILGDQAHTYGYHRARAVLPADDYSVVLRRDQLGPRWAASALDLTPGLNGPESMHQLTSNLVRAVQRRDRRLFRVVREFYGTLDGRTVYGWDLHSGTPQTSDSSHLWHVHLSFYRKHCTNVRALLPVAEVLAGA